MTKTDQRKLVSGSSVVLTFLIASKVWKKQLTSLRKNTKYEYFCFCFCRLSTFMYRCCLSRLLTTFTKPCPTSRSAKKLRSYFLQHSGWSSTVSTCMMTISSVRSSFVFENWNWNALHSFMYPFFLVRFNISSAIHVSARGSKRSVRAHRPELPATTQQRNVQAPARPWPLLPQEPRPWSHQPSAEQRHEVGRSRICLISVIRVIWTFLNCTVVCNFVPGASVTS